MTGAYSFICPCSSTEQLCARLVKLSPECKTTMEDVDRAFREVLAKVPADDVKEIEWFD